MIKLAVENLEVVFYYKIFRAITQCGKLVFDVLSLALHSRPAVTCHIIIDHGFIK